MTASLWLARLLAYRQLTVGLVVIAALVLLGLVGLLFVDVSGAQVGSAIPDLTPSREHPLGTDTVGRDLLSVIIVGTPLTLTIGLIAGVIGLGIGSVFGFIGGYYGGVAHNVLHRAGDGFLPVSGTPTLLW